MYTLHEINIAPANGWFEDEFPFGMAYFQVRTVSFRDGMKKDNFRHFCPSSTRYKVDPYDRYKWDEISLRNKQGEIIPVTDLQGPLRMSIGIFKIRH